MANELTLFSGGLPAYMKVGVDELTQSLMGSSNYKRISIRGGVFRMVVNGKEVVVNEDRAMNVVIVAAAPKSARTFYLKNYVEGEVAAPDCSSNNGETPDEGVPHPQSSTCASCPQNIKGSGKDDSRACRYSRRLAVVLENDIQSGDIYQLTLPAMSIFGTGENGKMPLEQYAKFIASYGTSVACVVTEMKFDTSAAVPKLTFRPVAALSEADVAAVAALGKTKEAQDAITFDASKLESPKTTPVSTAKATPKPTPTPAKKAPVVETADEVEEEEEIPAPKTVKKRSEIVEMVEEIEAEEAKAPEPKKRASKKETVPAPADVLAIMDEWDD